VILRHLFEGEGEGLAWV
jgi:hypothetical protein